ncbi:NAD-dependent epimerase/dehydratase family protein [Vibrio coralliirubri]|uniref:NAD-dependent epimerase/dehydratase family protein n=1 Tax=Vibrio coralliirubri TaxID=1516159 RepID=UPI002FD487CC
MNMLLTGSTGFVGSYLASEYCVYKHVVRRGESHNLRSVYTVESIDSTEGWDLAFEGVDVVVHLAGLAHSTKFSIEDYQEINTNGTLRLARKASEAGVKRLVFVSSIGVNGTATSSKPFEYVDEPCPHNSYSQSKFDAEVGLKKIAAETGLEVVIVRPALVYGPGAPGNFGALTRLVSKLPVLPFGLADNRRDFIALQNLADLLVTCASHPNASGHTFLASDLETVSIKEFTSAIGEGLGVKIVQLPIPVSLMRFVGKVTGKSAMIEQLYGDLQVDSSNIKEVLGWTPPLTMKQAMASLRNSSK